MAENKKQTKKQEVKKVYKSSDVVKFESNGKSKNMPKGEVYELDGVKANLLIEKGFGKEAK